MLAPLCSLGLVPDADHYRFAHADEASDDAKACTHEANGLNTIGVGCDVVKVANGANGGDRRVSDRCDGAAKAVPDAGSWRRPKLASCRLFAEAAIAANLAT